MICRLTKMRIWAGSIFAILFFLANTCFALTDTSVYPTISPYTYSFFVTAADVAVCQATDPSADRFIFYTITDSSQYEQALMFASVGAGATISTTTIQAGLQTIYFLCSDGTSGFDTTLDRQINMYWFDGNSGHSFVVASSSQTTSLSSSTIQEIDNPTQDYFYGIVLFLGTASFIIWVFRRRSV